MSYASSKISETEGSVIQAGYKGGQIKLRNVTLLGGVPLSRSIGGALIGNQKIKLKARKRDRSAETVVQGDAQVSVLSKPLLAADSVIQDTVLTKVPLQLSVKQRASYQSVVMDKK